MKSLHRTLGCLLLFLLTLTACRDECESTYTYINYEPILTEKSVIRAGIQSQVAQTLHQPGKIYFKDNYIFINEIKEGIHIINNADPSNPQNIGFIKIPGNVDMAVYGNILYADSYMDLVSIDISNPSQPQVLHRVEDVFLDFYRYWNTDNMIISGYEEKMITETYPCGDGQLGRPIFFDNLAGGVRNPTFNNAPPSTNNPGVGGSMARFAISQGYLYAVGTNTMQLFNLSTPSQPQNQNTINLAWGIETIFPYQDKLFLGSTTGMHIYDNQDPSAPSFISTYQHVMSCDPVVVQGDKAYVTLRRDNTCEQGVDALEVIDISDLQNPSLIKSYPMQHLHGLGIDQNTLFLCEGKFGLKVFDVQNALTIDQNLKQHFTGFDAYDVIPLGDVLLMIGKDGLYQYDYTNPESLRLLSKIPVVRD